MRSYKELDIPSPPRPQDRRAQCTHTTMTRLFDSDGTLICPHCGDSPDFGWVYTCTEDENRTAETDLANADNLPKSPPNDSPVLNEWVVRANEEGHYTKEEVKTLRAQRTSALETAQAQQLSMHKDYAAARSSLEAVFAAPSSPFTKWMARGLSSREGRTPSPVSAQCRLKLCHFCYLGGCDRSWISLNKACSNTDTKDVPFRNIYDIPTSDIARMPSLSPKKRDNLNDTSSHGKTFSMASDWDAINKEGKTASILERQKMKICEAHLRTSQYWSHIGLRQSLLRPQLESSGTGAEDTSSAVNEKDTYQVSTDMTPRSKPKRPRLLRRPKWTRDMMLRVQVASILNNSL